MKNKKEIKGMIKKSDFNWNSKRILFFLTLMFFIALSIVFVYAIPFINFDSITPTSGLFTRNNFVQINASIFEQNLANLTYNWNGTNYTMYNDSLILMMNFENLSALGENSTYVADLSKYGNNATANGSSWNSSGKYGGAMQFSGDSQYLSIPDANMFDTSTFTFSAWVNFAGQTLVWNRILSKKNTYSDNNGYEITLWDATNTTALYLSGSGSTNAKIDCVSNWTNSGWHHILAVYSGTTVTLYCDGISRGSGTIVAVAANSQNLSIGKCMSETTTLWNGTIDDIKMWNRTLTSNEAYEQYISNLQKYNQTQWYLYVNQSKNATAGLADGNYTYQIFATNTSGTVNSSELRTLNIDSINPQINFTSLTPANATLTTNTSFVINVSISEQNLANLTYNWNGTNYTIYNDSLVLMMNFDNLSALGENSTRVVDVSKYGNIGTIIGATWNSSGKYGGAMQFNGSSRNITIPVVFNGNNPRTVSIWFNPSATQTSSGTVVGMFSVEGWSTLKSYVLTIRNNDCPNNGIGLHYWLADTCTNITLAALGPGQWHQMVATHNGTDQQIFIDGILKNTTSLTLDTTSVEGKFYIGHRPGDWNYFNGTIDEVRIWNRSLTADEIYEQYISNLNKFNSTQWYLFVNQSKNATDVLTNGTNTYQVFVSDVLGSTNQTEQRVINILSDINYPLIDFIGNTPVDNVNTTNSTVGINVSIIEQNLASLTYNWNSTNFTMYNNSLVLMMNFENYSSLGENSTHIKDISKYGNNGTISGATWNSSGKYNGAYTFDGNNDYINVTNSQTLNLTQKFSVSAWAYINAHKNYNFILSKGNDAAEEFELMAGSDGIVWGTTNFVSGRNSCFYSPTAISTQRWYHLSMVYNGSICFAYIDGVLVWNSTTRTGLSPTTQPFLIGAEKDGSGLISGRFLNGSVDEVRIWNRSLSAEEVYEQYVSNLQKFNSTQWYLFVNQSKNATNVLDNLTYTYQIFANDTAGNINQSEQRTINILQYIWPKISIDWIYPTSNINVTQNEFFNISVNITCLAANCSNINVTLDPATGTSYNFTTCGASGRLGPTQSQCNTNYTGTSLAGLVTVGNATADNGTQNWTVPATGTYTIEVAGAAGGNGSTSSYKGGYGARMIGTFSLTQGQVIKIIVGQKGTDSSSSAGGGGGGSFVVLANNTPLIVAGGGGGGGGNTGAGNGQNASLNTSGKNGSSGVYTGGINGLGGGASGGSAGGGGLTGNGTSSSCAYSPGKGTSFISGGYGGVLPSGGCTSGGAGGFGGGSAGEWCCMGASGAGGGYSGGAGTDSSGIAGGGGSYNLGTNQNNSIITMPTQGYVSITYTGSGKGGIVSMNSSVTPFWTNITNPYNLTMNENDSQIITWYVNATGTNPNTPYEFYVYSNMTSNSTIGNQTSAYNITILDSVYPLVSIIYPADGANYSVNVSSLNYSFSDYSTGGYCWYSNNSGIWNSTTVSAGTNFTNISSVDGNNTWTLYCNDSGGNLNSSMVNFTRDITSPNATLLYPHNNTFSNSSSNNFTVNISDSVGIGNATLNIYNISNNLVNSTNVTYSPGTLGSTMGIVVVLVDGIYKWFYQVFDNLGNSFTTSNNTITIDTAYPNTTLVSPINGNYYNTSLPLFNITSSETLNVSIIINLDNSLISWWRMDELNDSGDIVDYFGKNNGSNINSTQVTNGKFGKAFSFNGINSYINIANSNSLNMSRNNFSFGAWIYPNNVTGNFTIISKTNLTTDNSTEYLLQIQNGYILAVVGNTTGNCTLATGAGSVSAKAWQQVIATYNRTNLAVYINGTLSSQKTCGLGNVTISSLIPLTIGNKYNISNYINYFNGSIDNAMIFNRSLITAEVLSLYNSTRLSHSSINLSNGNHSLEIYVQDFAGNVNLTSINFLVDTANPNATLVSPANLTASNNYTYNFTVNISDNVGIRNATFNIWNRTGLFNQTTTNFTEGTFNTTLGNVLTLVDGIYNWSYQISDYAGNRFTTGNFTLNVDNIYPIFSNYWDNNGTVVGSGIARFNVTVINTNGTVWLEINGFNYSATNTSPSSYNYSLSLVNETYVYKWWAYGNGTAKNINNSVARNYTINNTHLGAVILLNLINPTTNINVTQNDIFNVTVNITCLNYSCGLLNITLDPIAAGKVVVLWDTYTSSDYTDGSLNIAQKLATNISGTFDSSLSGSGSSTPTNESFWSQDIIILGTSTSFNSTKAKNAVSNGKIVIAPMFYFTNISGDLGLIKYNFTSPFATCTDSGSQITQPYTLNYSCTSNGGMIIGDPTPDQACTWEHGCQQYVANNWAYVINNNPCTSGKGGIVSTNSSATPFWANFTNPYNFTLSENESQIITWWVNATGRTPNNPYEFFVYSNISGNLTIGSQTQKWNVTIKDYIAPIINITYPENLNYSVNVSTLNYSFLDYSTGGYCWYSNNSGIWNSTTVIAGTNITNAISIDGNNNWTLYCNDSAGNIANITSVLFFRDTVYPKFSSYGDNNATMNGSGIARFNVTISNTNGSVFLEINGTNYTANNVTATVWNYSLTLTNGTYSYKWISFGNATLNNLNVSATRNYTLLGNLNIVELNASNISGVVAGTVLQGGNVTINATVENAVNVLLKIWRSFIGGQILYQAYMNNAIGNLWSLTVKTNTTWPTGDTNYTIYANDSLRYQINMSGTFNVLDTKTPDIYFMSPANNTFTNVATQYFVANISENVELVNATFYIWNSTNSTINITTINISGTSNITNISFVLPYDNQYLWNYYSCDNSSNCAWNSTNWTITYDTVAPNVNLIYPTNTTYNINTRWINYSFYDLNVNGSCWYSNNSGIWNSTSVAAGTNFTGVNSTEGSNTWTLYCNDSAGNINSSSITFNKDTPYINITRIYPNENITTITVGKNFWFNVSVNVSCSNANCGEVNVTLDPISTNYTFTACGATGRLGPNISQCNTNYSTTNLAGQVGVVNGIQNWTVPAGVSSITITAKGASGGYYGSGAGGFGTIMQGTFSVTPGQILFILVGQTPGSTTNFAGGGGGTFVATGTNYSNSTALIVAGGGGGGYSVYGINASLTVNGTGINPGRNGNGGGASSCGGGGGGFNSTGATDTLYSHVGGSGFKQGGNGGLAETSYQDGGFGGGAPADYDGSCYNTAGAAGGYSGGSGHNSGSGSDKSYGQGGGSFNNGTNQNNSVSSTAGNGYVIIAAEVGKGGTVSMTNGTTPFYTNITNPYNLTLNEGQSQVITWWVNATGNYGNYTFYVYANKTEDLSITNVTTIWNVSVYNLTLDTNAPVIKLLSPANGTGSRDSSQYFAANFSDEALLVNSTLYIWNSTNSTINTTFNNINGSANLSNISVTLPYENLFKWNFYACDNSSNCGWNSTNFTFIYDITPPYFTSIGDISVPDNRSLNSTITAGDNVLLDSYSINWTANFTINKTTGLLKNSSALRIGSYYINITINDTANNLNSSVIMLTITNSSVVDSMYPIFSNYSDNNGSIISGGTAIFNVTVINTNGTVWLRINGTNYTASNLTSNTYNVSIAGLSNGTYVYNWSAYGNGTYKNLNISDNRNYSVNPIPPSTSLYLDWIYPTANINLTQNNFFNVSVNVSCLYGNCGQVNVTLDPMVGYGTNSPYDSGTSANGCKENSSSGTIDSCSDGSTCNYPFKIERIYIVDLNNSQFTIGDTVNVTFTTNTGCCSPDVVWVYSNNTNGGNNFTNKGYTLDIATGLRNYSKTFVLDNVVGNHTIRGINIYSTASSSLLCGFSQSYGYLYSDTDDVVIYVKESSSTKGGTISMNSSSTPFYTNVTNPYSLNLSGNQSQVITWFVNATGRTPNYPYEFFIYANSTTNSSITTASSKLNITIIDNISPVLNITYPINTTYSGNVTALNYTFSDYSTGGYCWYSNNSGIWNSTTVSAGTNFTGLNYGNDYNNLTLYCNDSGGNLGSANVSFSRRASQILLDIIYPTENINVNKSAWFNVTVNVSCLFNSCGRINVSLDPEIYPTQCTNYTNINWDSYNVNASSSSACSNTLTAKWYRLNGTYNEIAEQRSYVTGICSAGSPGFLNFTHPTAAGYTNNGSICYHWNNNVCNWKSNGVNVTKCSTYYVYYLTPAPACSLQPCTTNNITDPTPAYTKFGLVNKTTGATPFYTNVDNPYNISLNQGESQTITWYVNATGTINATYEFFVYANSTDYTWLTNSSSHWNVTINNGTVPVSDFTYPIFSNYQDNGPLTSIGRGFFNVTVNNTNGTVWLSINNTNITATLISSNKYNASYNFTDYGNYSHKWYAYGNGNFTNLNSSMARYFNLSYRETTPPILIIISPLNTNYTIANTNFTLSLNENASWCGFSLDNSLNITMTLNSSLTGANYTNSTMSQGSHSVIFSCNDTSGNMNSTSRSFMIDSVAPQISFISPANTTYITKNISISILNNSDAKFIWFNRGLGNETYTSSISKIFSEGSNIIYGFANDSLGNLNSTNVTFFIDSVSPSIIVNSPNEKTYVTSSIPFNITTNENASCWFVLNSTNNYTLDTSDSRNFNYSSSLPDNTYTIYYYCNDSLNNLGISSVKFGIKTVPPQISLNSPKLNRYYRNSTVQFNYTPMATNGLDTCELWGNWTGTWHKNDTTTSLTNYSDNYFIKTLDDGTYYWNIWCNNTQGFTNWSTQGNITFTVHRTAPQISFISPLNTSYNTSIITIEITNDSDASLIWWNNGSTNFSYDYAVDINVLDGNYNYTAYANDSAGNLNQTSVIFNVDTSISNFSNYYSDNASIIGNGIGVFNITVLRTNGTVLLYINNTQISATNLSADVYNATYNFSSEGTYSYYWISYSNGTNHLIATSLTKIYTVNETDKIAPNATLLSPENNSYINYTNINLTANLSDITSVVEDTESGIKNATLNVYNYSNNAIINQTTVNFSAGTLTNTVGVVVYLVNGVYNWFYSIFDRTGNVFVTGNRTLTVDIVPPAIRITSNINNTVVNDNPLKINLAVSDTYLNKCYYYDQGYTPGNITMDNCSELTIENVMEGGHNLTVYANDSAGNTNSTGIIFTMDASPPEVNLNSPDDSYGNDSSYEVNVTFNCSATDSINLSRIDLYINDIYNQSTNITNAANSSAWTVSLNKGNYTWNCLAYDSVGNNQLSYSSRLLMLNFSDTDDDRISDISDNLIGREYNVNSSGTSSFNITIDGNSTYGSYNNTHEVTFIDSGKKFMNFTFNFSQDKLNLSKITIIKANNSIIVNVSGQLQFGYSKTVYIDDNEFVDLCVKDSAIESISNISESCSESDETNFSQCINNMTGVTKGYLNCTDEGSRIRIDNLIHSAIRGTPAVEEETPPSSETSSSGSSGGGTISKSNKTNATLTRIECYSNADCPADKYCFENKCYSKECINNSQCEKDKSCWNYHCVKLFDMKILEVSKNFGDSISVTYFLKAMANISNDVIINLWIEKDGKIISSGKDTIFIGNMEEKTESSKLFIPKDILPGEYNLYVSVSYEKYTAESHRQIEIDESGNVLFSFNNSLLYIIPLLILIIILLSFIVIKLEIKRIKNFFEYQEEWILTHKLFITILGLCIISIVTIVLLGVLNLITIPELGDYSGFGEIFIRYLLTFPIYLIVGIIVLLSLIIFVVWHKRKVHRRLHGLSTKRKNYLEHGLKKIRHKIIQSKISKKVKVLEKKGYDVDLIRRDSQKHKLEEWKKKGYDTDLINRKKESINNKIEEWRKKGYDVDSLKR